MRGLRVLSLCLHLLFAAALIGQGRELHWDRMHVVATLDADGRLHVEESQSMVFTGDWNGGERTFNIRPRQELSFEGMTRVDASGVEHPMQEGSLDQIDHFSFTDANVLRWRARQPSDPPFANTTITYVLRYTLSGILQRDGERYVLSHDFAFSNREGVIRDFGLDITLDPVWSTDEPLQQTWKAQNIPPGESFVLTVPLTYRGGGAPVASGDVGVPPRMLLLALGIGPLLLFGYAMLREALLGRLERGDPAQITRGWIEHNLLRERPEVIGTMWEGTVGADEVSATLARMVNEGRLKSEVKGSNLKLEILTRKDLEPYEQALLDGLFFRGNHTSTDAIRTHYKDSGFDPAKLMEAPLKEYAAARLPQGAASKPFGLLSWLLFGGAIYRLVQHANIVRDFVGQAFAIAFGALVLCGLASISAAWWRARKALGLGAALAAMIPAVVLIGVAALVVWRSSVSNWPWMTTEFQQAVTLFGLWIASVVTNNLRSLEGREAIAHLKMLGLAREFFRRELKKERPALDDSWYPYALAFGLDGDVQRWFRSFPGAASSRFRDDDRFSSSSSSSFGSSSSGWSGGGGAFGGAGASGTWAMAAAGMAAGVAAPSSSSSGGGSSSSSGGSSGGGGGGGW